MKRAGAATSPDLAWLSLPGRDSGGRPGPGRRTPAGLRRPTIWLLAVATGAIAANLYYVQPLLHLIATTFGVSNGAAGLLVTVTQIGFAVGLVLLLPLADVVNGRRLFSALLVVNATGLAVVASAPDITVAITGFAVVGLTTWPPRSSCPPPRRWPPTSNAAGWSAP